MIQGAFRSPKGGEARCLEAELTLGLATLPSSSPSRSEDGPSRLPALLRSRSSRLLSLPP
jgi:hypothetical protein